MEAIGIEDQCAEYQMLSRTTGQGPLVLWNGSIWSRMSLICWRNVLTASRSGD